MTGRREPPVGQALRAALGSPVTVRRMTSSPRSRVWLVEFDGTPAIVKQVAGGADARDRYTREMTALRLAARTRPPVVPALLAADPDSRIMVLEYLTSRKPPATGWMTSYATALAQLHAAAGPGDANALPAWCGPAPADAQAFLNLATQLQVPIAAGLPGELGDLLGRLYPATGCALLHGDPCPDNTVHTSSGIRFIDLEQAKTPGDRSPAPTPAAASLMLAQAGLAGVTHLSARPPRPARLPEPAAPQGLGLGYGNRPAAAAAPPHRDS